MIVEQEGMISAVVYCKQRILMAAQLEKVKFGGELEGNFGKAEEATGAGEKLAGKTAAVDVRDEEETAIASSKGGDEDATSATVKTDDDTNLEIDTTGKDEQVEGDDEKDKEPEASNAKGKEPKTDKIPKVHILQLRAEGMAEEMADDELKDFIMPKDFF